ncbi:MAG: histidine kinase dimerization/phospho-acceptor domain-containing protein [Candidatus Dormibacter sp.]
MEEVSSQEPVATPALRDPDSIAQLCHELRQPLVVAVGYVSMLDEGTFGDLPDEVRAVLGTVAERLDAMNEIIDRIADRA